MRKSSDISTYDNFKHLTNFRCHINGSVHEKNLKGVSKIISDQKRLFFAVSL